MSIHNCLDLLFPEVDGVLTQDVKKGVVLSRSNRDFQDIANKVGHDGATTAVLRV